MTESHQEKQPSQEPKDDGEECGPCGFLLCEDAIIERTACNHCELNPEGED